MKNSLIWLLVFTGLFILCFSGCGNTGESENNIPISELTDFQRGELIYKKSCVSCHGSDGKLGFAGASDLTVSTLTAEEKIDVIHSGRGAMMAFNRVLTPVEIRLVADYIATLRK